MMTKHLRTKQLLLLLLAIFSLVSCKQETEEPIVDNLLLKEWIGPYGGVPAFELMKIEDVKAFLAEKKEIGAGM